MIQRKEFFNKKQVFSRIHKLRRFPDTFTMSSRTVFYYLISILICGASAQAENFGYLVTGSDKTLIQIARDAYNDQRLWKKIALWNNISAPYLLRKGQIISLPLPPTQRISAVNLVTGAQVPNIQKPGQKSSVRQNILKEKNKLFYIVNERAPSLWMVARELYGNQKMAPVIASWNRLPKDARLSLDQKLSLRVAPTQNATSGTAKLITVWSQLGNPDMVARLGGNAKNIIKKINSFPTATSPAEDQVESQAVSPVAPTLNQNSARTLSPEADPELIAAPAPVAAPAPIAAPERLPSSVPSSEDLLEPKDDSYWLGEERLRILKKISNQVGP